MQGGNLFIDVLLPGTTLKGCAKPSFHKAQINPFLKDVRELGGGPGPRDNYVTFLCHNLKKKGLGETFVLDHL